MRHCLSFDFSGCLFVLCTSSLRAGEGLKAQGKSRVRGGVKIQQAKHNLKMAEERKQQDEHSRSLTMKLAQITEKALDKLPS